MFVNAQKAGRSGKDRFLKSGKYVKDKCGEGVLDRFKLARRSLLLDSLGQIRGFAE